LASKAEKEIRMQDPLKQGLKQARKKGQPPTKPIRMQDPLKQGLKPEFTCRKRLM